MANLTVVQPSHLTGFANGLAGCAVAAGGSGDYFLNGPGSVLFFVKNQNANAVSVTFLFNSNSTIDGQSANNPVGSVANGQEQIFGPFLPSYYSDYTNGTMNITYSNATNVTVMPFYLGN